MLLRRRLPFLIIPLIFAGQVLAQTNSNSPYSRFGLGMMSQPGFTKNRAMGGAGIAFRDNNQINYLNPASYTAIDTMSFLFDFGLMGHYTYTETGSVTDDFYGMNMDHLAFAFPVTKWMAASVGMRPYSKVGYSIKEEDWDPDIGFIDYTYMGNGGVSQLYLGTSFEFFDRLYLGINFKYLFGSLDLERTVRFPLENYYSYTEVKSRTLINDFILDMGLQYSQNIREKSNITFGVIFDNKTKVSAENSVSKRNIFPGNSAPTNDSTLISPAFTLEDRTTLGNIVIPTNVGVGISYSYNNKLRIGFDYYSQDWSNSTFFSSEEPLTESNSFHGGLEFVPDKEALKGYHKRIAYRLGGHYQNSYLQLEGEQLKDYGISFGVGLPLKNPRSSFQVACEAGRRGALENNLIRENYMFLSFSVTLHDFWFVKRKFD
jgi:hypothetical protein